METNQPVIVVTGGNRGIGFEICSQLARRGAQVILTARSTEAGRAAVRKISEHGLRVRFQALDVTRAESVSALHDYVEGAFHGLDVLINNAGILPPDNSDGLQVKLDIVRAVFETNTLAPLHLSQVLAPLLKRSERGGRIINMSSGLGALSPMQGGYAAYRISKTGLNAVTRILAAELSGTVAVNSMCPGWVKTDMGGANADREVAEGAETAVWLALDAPRNLTGQFLRDRQVIEW